MVSVARIEGPRSIYEENSEWLQSRLLLELNSLPARHHTNILRGLGALMILSDPAYDEVAQGHEDWMLIQQAQKLRDSFLIRFDVERSQRETDELHLTDIS
jgi:hypothetical protein